MASEGLWLQSLTETAEMRVTMATSLSPTEGATELRLKVRGTSASPGASVQGKEGHRADASFQTLEGTQLSPSCGCPQPCEGVKVSFDFRGAGQREVRFMTGLESCVRVSAVLGHLRLWLEDPGRAELTQAGRAAVEAITTLGDTAENVVAEVGCFAAVQVLVGKNPNQADVLLKAPANLVLTGGPGLAASSLPGHVASGSSQAADSHGPSLLWEPNRPLLAISP